MKEIRIFCERMRSNTSSEVLRTIIHHYRERRGSHMSINIVSTGNWSGMHRILLAVWLGCIGGCISSLEDPYYLGLPEDRVLHLRDENPTVESYVADIITMTKVKEVPYTEYLKMKKRAYDELQPIASSDSPEELVAAEVHGKYVYFSDIEIIRVPMPRRRGEGLAYYSINIRHRYKSRLPRK